MKNSAPLVSVVIATYRRASLVTRAVQSVQKQTYKNVQIIVVDDGSPDNTGDVISRLNDSRIQYIRHATNCGQSAGRNTGIKAAKGEYVAFLDDDDEWIPTKLEKQLDCLLSNGYDAVLCASVGSSGRIRRHKRSSVTPSDLKRGNEFAPGSGLLVKTTVIQELMFDVTIGQGEDWDVLIRIVQNYKIGYLDEILYIVDEGVHERMTNQAQVAPLSELEQRMNVLHKHREFYGTYWYNVHIADTLLSYLWDRPEKILRIRQAIRRCGLVPVIGSLYGKFQMKLVNRRRHGDNTFLQEKQE